MVSSTRSNNNFWVRFFFFLSAENKRPPFWELQIFWYPLTFLLFWSPMIKIANSRSTFLPQMKNERLKSVYMNAWKSTNIIFYQWIRYWILFLMQKKFSFYTLLFKWHHKSNFLSILSFRMLVDKIKSVHYGGIITQEPKG